MSDKLHAIDEQSIVHLEADDESPAALETLPSELLATICHHLPCPDGLIGAMFACRSLHSAACDASVWHVMRLGTTAPRAWTVERLGRLLRCHASQTSELHCLGLRCMDDSSVHVLQHAASLTALHLPQCSRLTTAGLPSLPAPSRRCGSST